MGMDNLVMDKVVPYTSMGALSTAATALSPGTQRMEILDFLELELLKLLMLIIKEMVVPLT